MRSLLKRFYPKVTTIEESKDLDKIKVEELLGSLQLELKLKTVRKDLALKSTNKKSNKDEELDENFKLLSTKFRKFLKTKKMFSSNNKKTSKNVRRRKRRKKN